MNTIGLQSEKMTKTSFDEERVKAAAKRVANVEGVTNATPAISSAVQPKTESVFQVLQVAMRERRFVKDTFLTEPEKLQELEKSSAFYHNVNQELAGHL